MQWLRLLWSDGPHSIPIRLPVLCSRVEWALPFSRVFLCFLKFTFFFFPSLARCGHCMPPIATKWTCCVSSGCSEVINKSWQTERHDRCLSHYETGSYDAINYCTNYELPELEKSLLLDVFLVDWLLLVFTGSVKLSCWCLEPRISWHILQASL